MNDLLSHAKDGAWESCLSRIKLMRLERALRDGKPWDDPDDPVILVVPKPMAPAVSAVRLSELDAWCEEQLRARGVGK